MNVLCLATARTACGQTPEDRASARVLGTEAVRLADSGDCPSAIPKFEAAEKLYHAPTTLERLGECQIKVGHLIAGTENLNRVVHEPLPPNPPPAFVAAQTSAAQLLASTTPRIAKLRIHVEGAPPDQVTVAVDGVGVPSALLDDNRPTDPGEHDVTASAAGFRQATVRVKLADGAEQRVSLPLEADPNAVRAPSASAPASSAATAPASPLASATAPAPPTVTPAPTAPAESGSSSHTGAFVALGVGVAGIAVGSIFGGLALGTKSSLDSACTNKSCPAASKGNIDSLSTQAWVSNAGFAVGIVGAVVGIALLATSHGDGEKQAPTAAHVTPWVGPGAAGLGGTFE